MVGLLVSLGMGILSARIAGAAPAPDATVVELRKSEGALVRATAEKGALEKKLSALTATIATLKQTGGADLEQKLAASQELSRSLAALAGRVRALEATIAAERRALIEAIDGELAGNVTDARRAELAALRKETLDRAAAATSRVVSIAQPKVGKLDDPADLAEKAALLAASERKLRAQAGVLARRAAGMDKRLKLRRAAERANDGDLFADDSPRRRAATAGETRKTGGNADAAENAGGRTNVPNAPSETNDGAFSQTPSGAAPPPSPGPAQSNGDATGGQPAPQGTSSPIPAVRTPRDADVDLAGDPSVVLVDVLDPATLAELRTAQRTGDPARQISALRKAEASLRTLADDLARRQAAMKKRAAELRKQK